MRRIPKTGLVRFQGGRSLTFELLDRKRYDDTDRAQLSITEWIDGFYNAQRRHTALGNMSPIKYELACQMRKRRT